MRLRVVVDSTTFEAGYADITAEHVRVFNQYVQRVTLRDVLSDAATHDLDVAAGLVWLTMPDTPIGEVFAGLALDAVCVVQLVDEEG